MVLQIGNTTHCSHITDVLASKTQKISGTELTNESRCWRNASFVFSRQPCREDAENPGNTRFPGFLCLFCCKTAKNQRLLN
jgi:hypothetical protein